MSFDDPCTICGQPAVILTNGLPRCADHFNTPTDNSDECAGQGVLALDEP